MNARNIHDRISEKLLKMEIKVVSKQFEGKLYFYLNDGIQQAFFTSIYAGAFEGYSFPLDTFVIVAGDEIIHHGCIEHLGTHGSDDYFVFKTKVDGKLLQEKQTCLYPEVLLAGQVLIVTTKKFRSVEDYINHLIRVCIAGQVFDEAFSNNKGTLDKKKFFKTLDVVNDAQIKAFAEKSPLYVLDMR